MIASWTCEHCGRTLANVVLPVHCSCRRQMPAVVIQAGTALSELARWVAAGRPIRPAGERDRIETICEACPHFQANRCTLCGCNLPLKISWGTTSCPDDPPRW